MDLPWQGHTPAAAQSSYDGAIAAERHAATDCAKLITFLRSRGPCGATDAEVESWFNWPANISTARRNDLIDRGLVVHRVVGARRLSVKSRVRVSVWIASEFARVRVE